MFFYNSIKIDFFEFVTAKKRKFYGFSSILYFKIVV